MANFFWRANEGEKALLATPFKTEAEFDRTVSGSSELREDIFHKQEFLNDFLGGGYSGYFTEPDGKMGNFTQPLESRKGNIWRKTHWSRLSKDD